MRIQTRGDGLIILRDLPGPSSEIAKSIDRRAKDEGWAGFIECSAAFDKVGLYVEPYFDLDLLDRPFPIEAEGDHFRHFQIPALYDGSDLEDAADFLGITADQLVETHSSAIYTVEAIGFCPGFPYLSGMPERLHGLERLPSPRQAVEPGTIAIVGDQCGIYPLTRPGGWHLIAKTPLILVEPEDEFYALAVGDRIRFHPISESEYDRRQGERCLVST